MLLQILHDKKKKREKLIFNIVFLFETNDNINENRKIFHFYEKKKDFFSHIIKKSNACCVKSYLSCSL